MVIDRVIGNTGIVRLPSRRTSKAWGVTAETIQTKHNECVRHQEGKVQLQG